MNRRDFFKYSAAMSSVIGLPVLAVEKQILTLNVISQITPETSVNQLRTVLETFVANGLPVSCVVNTLAKDGSTLHHDSRLATFLRSLMHQAPGLVEIVGYVEGLSSQSPYFQARSAFATRNRLLQALGQPDRPDQRLQFLSLACSTTTKPTAPVGVRSAGFRNVLLMPSKDALVVPEIWDNGTLRLIGGKLVALSAPGTLGERHGAQHHNVNVLDAGAFESVPNAGLAASALEFAGAAAHFERVGRISNQRVLDLQLRDNYGFQRLVGVHLFEPPVNDLTLQRGFNALQSDLAQLEVPFSWGPEIQLGPEERTGSGYWLPTESIPQSTKNSQPQMAQIAFEFRCLGKDGAVERGSNQPLPAGIGLTSTGADFGVQGIDSCGHLRLPTVPVTRLISGGSAGATSDLLMTIAPEMIATKAQRAAVHRKLREVKSDWVSRFVPVSTFASAILSNDPLISLSRKTEAAVAKIAPQKRRLDPEQRQRFMDDAKVAWGYFTRFTNAKTGLCPATVNFAPGGKRLHETVTMWDVGSHILALIAAVDLELISEKVFRKSISKIIPNIAGRRSDDRLLPQGWIRTDRHRWGNANFDGCDAGRLLSALWNLKQHRFTDKRVSDLVASWDLEEIIFDGEIQSVIKGKLKSTYGSQCAHYSAISFRRWGLDVSSPYEVSKTLSDGDQKMAVLEATSKISPIGAEPLLLEALELGHAKETAYLADVLLGAQIEDYEKTGVLVCASEGPIDQKPWFTYQGLKLDAVKGRWVIDTVGDLPEFKNPAFQSSARVISSKASFLWAAHAPNAYSDRLLELVRSKSKTKNGFASSIYSNSGRSTTNYSDLNTNGIILQSIAHVMATQV
ncbi:MAG: DUF3131 domain-containing protein [Rhodobacteraceae bacterium]|nr:DUF3131 domain-containing protein [Paracoccaceae bacterium]